MLHPQGVSWNSRLERAPQWNAVLRAYTYPFVVTAFVGIFLRDQLINVSLLLCTVLFMASESPSVFLTVGSLGLCVGTEWHSIVLGRKEAQKDFVVWKGPEGK